MLKIRWLQDNLVFNMGIPILVRRHLYIERAPRFPYGGCSLCFLFNGCKFIWLCNMNPQKSLIHVQYFGSMSWLVAYLVWSHYVNQCWMMIITIVPADGLPSICARPSAGTVQGCKSLLASQRIHERFLSHMKNALEIIISSFVTSLFQVLMS